MTLDLLLEDSVTNRAAFIVLVTLSSISPAAAQNAIQFPKSLVISQSSVRTSS